MSVHELRREQWLPVELDRVFEFFSVAQNLERITPPWLRFELRTPGPIEMRTGTLIDYRLRLHGIPLRWRSRIEEWEPGRLFVDRQLIGPYRLWHHRHEFEPRGGGTLVRDIVRYELPLPPLGDLALPFVKRDLERIFAHRREATERLLVRAPAAVGR
jgi:ligand-binding SRPBCC domain-containing protein